MALIKYIMVAARGAASKCRNAKKKLSFSGNGIFTVSQLLQSGISQSGAAGHGEVRHCPALRTTPSGIEVCTAHG
jgi:hypothetical protein